MNRMTGVMLVMAGLAVSVSAEMVGLVQITDMRGNVGYEIVTREQYADLLKQIREETAAYGPAAAESKKEWDADKENKLPFQGNRIKPRSVKKVGDFPNPDKANDKKSTLEERASEKQLEEMDKGKDKGKKKQAKPSDEEVAKEAARMRAFEDAHNMIAKKMGEKLGRPVPSFGFAMEEPKKDEGKKEEVKKDEGKKEEKKDEGKKEEKKEEKKGGGH